MKPLVNLRLDFVARSKQETAKLCAHLYQHLSLPVLISLTGPLGAGKTQIAQFFAQNFGTLERLISSSFLKVRVYFNAKQQQLLHIDSYNTKSTEEVWMLLHDHPDAQLVILEWANPTLLQQVPLPVIEITIDYLHEFERQITLQGPEAIIKNVAADFKIDV